MAKILVVGAGISGATIANLCSQSENNEICIIDRYNNIAGNCYDYRDENNIMVHKYGSHIFHTSDENVWRFLSQFTEFNTYTHKVIGFVQNELVPIPFNFNSMEILFSPEYAETVRKKLLKTYPSGSRIPIMEFMKQDDEDLHQLAEYVYEHIFLRYTEKQWGKSPDKVSGSVSARVPVVLGTDDRYFVDSFQGIPLEGYTQMIHRMLDRPNIEIRLNTQFQDLKDISEFDKIFFTGPIDELLEYRFGQLPYRSLRFDNRILDQEHYQPNSVVNYTETEQYTRVHEYKYYLGDKSDKTFISFEYPEEFVIGKNDRYYPVPGQENEALYAKYLEAAKKEYPNMRFLGRLGDYRYYNMDQAVARAMAVYQEVFH